MSDGEEDEAAGVPPGGVPLPSPRRSPLKSEVARLRAALREAQDAQDAAQADAARAREDLAAQTEKTVRPTRPPRPAPCRA